MIPKQSGHSFSARSLLNLRAFSFYGQIAFVVESWLERGLFHGFFTADLNVKDGSLNWNRRFLPQGGPRLLCLKQVHGVEVVNFSSWLSDSPEEFAKLLPGDPDYLLEADGWLAQLDDLGKYNIALGIRSADCFPVFLSTKETKYQRHWVGVLHCGWRSTIQGILPQAIFQLQDLGISPANIEMVVGPGAGEQSYTIGKDVEAEVLLALARLKCSSMATSLSPEEANDARKIALRLGVITEVSEDNPVISGDEHCGCGTGGFQMVKTSLALSRFLEIQAIHLGLKPENIVTFFGCTISDPRFFSFRRQGSLAGRQVSVVGPSLGKNIYQGVF